MKDSGDENNTASEEHTPKFELGAFLMNPILYPGRDIAPYEEQINARLEDPTLLEWISNVLGNRIVGEDLNKLTLFLIALSYKIDDPQGVIITGPPSIGKSHLSKNVLRLFPNVINLSRITGAVLDRLEIDFDHYILYISELGGQEQATPILRVMLSEGELRLATTTQEKGRIVPKVIQTVGTPVYITTTTQEIVERQLASRTWMLNLDTTKEQTQRILHYQAKKASTVNKDEYTQEEMVLRALLYKLKPHKVLISYAEKLSALFPSGEPQARRDFKRLLALIKCATLAFQKQRMLLKSKGEEVLLASLTDLGYALKLVKPILFTTLYALPEKAFEILDFFKNIKEDTVKEAAKKVNLSQNRTRTIMNGLVDRGFLYKDDSRKPHRYSWTEKELEEPTILATVNPTAFFTQEDFEKWFVENECTCSKGSGAIYDQYIVGPSLHAFEQVQPSENMIETMFKAENKPEESTVAETVHPKQTLDTLKFEDVLSGPAYLAAEMFHEDTCVMCGDKTQLTHSVFDMKPERHYICDNCAHTYKKWKDRGEA